MDNNTNPNAFQEGFLDKNKIENIPTEEKNAEGFFPENERDSRTEKIEMPLSNREVLQNVSYQPQDDFATDDNSDDISVKDEAEVINEVRNIRVQDKNEQVKRLCDLAFMKGVNYAINVASRLEDPYVLDHFHDLMIEQFYQKLVQTGKIKTI